MLLVRSLLSPLHVGEQSMGTFRSVLHSCGHRKVPTRHAPNPCHCSVRRRRPQPHPPTTPTRSPCPAPSTRPAPRVAACTGGRGSHPHHEHHLSGTAVPLHPSRPGPVTTPQNPPPHGGAAPRTPALPLPRPAPLPPPIQRPHQSSLSLVERQHAEIATP